MSPLRWSNGRNIICVEWRRVLRGALSSHVESRLSIRFVDQMWSAFTTSSRLQCGIPFYSGLSRSMFPNDWAFCHVVKNRIERNISHVANDEKRRTMSVPTYQFVVSRDGKEGKRRKKGWSELSVSSLFCYFVSISSRLYLVPYSYLPVTQNNDILPGMLTWNPNKIRAFQIIT